MSDTYLTLIPEDPTHVPAVEDQRGAAAALHALVPQALRVEVLTYDQVTFIDQGSNFERIECPACAHDVTNNWAGWMEDALVSQFSQLPSPCRAAE